MARGETGHVEVGYELAHVGQVRNALSFHRFLGKCRDSDGNFIDALLALGRGDDDFFEHRGLLGLLILSQHNW